MDQHRLPTVSINGIPVTIWHAVFGPSSALPGALPTTRRQVTHTHHDLTRENRGGRGRAGEAGENVKGQGRKYEADNAEDKVTVAR